MGKSIKSQSNCGRAVGATMVAPTPCDSMSLQLVIPRRVALQQSPLPLHQLAAALPQGRGTWQSPTRRYLNTNLTRGLTSGGHPIPIPHNRFNGFRPRSLHSIRRSPTTTHRQLKTVETVQKPDWSADHRAKARCEWEAIYRMVFVVEEYI